MTTFNVKPDLTESNFSDPGHRFTSPVLIPVHPEKTSLFIDSQWRERFSQSEDIVFLCRSWISRLANTWRIPKQKVFALDHSQPSRCFVSISLQFCFPVKRKGISTNVLSEHRLGDQGCFTDRLYLIWETSETQLY